MSFIGEAVLGASVQMLIEKLAPEGVELLTRHEKLKADFIKWKGMLEMIGAVLADAEDRQTKEKAVKMWLDNLQNLAYDLEDVLDEFQTESLRRELLPQEPAAVDQSSASTSTIWKLTDSLKRKFTDAVTLTKIPKLSASDSPRSSFNFESKMASQIEEVTARLQSIVSTQKDFLKLKNVISDGKYRNVRQILPTTSLVNEAKVYGREKEKEEIIELLLNDDLRADDGFSVISINGMGGVGKTTLAQFVHNDDRVQDHFQIKAWTCVSEDFDVSRVTKSILKSIAKDQSNNDDDLNSLQVKLKERLSGNKFLLVLDDVWNENYNDWSTLSCPFGAGAPGSKIVVTTRIRVVAERMGADPVYQLKELSDDDCLCVLTQISLGARDFSRHQSLKEVGEQIVKKCGGLPLAAKTLGGLLRGKDDPKDWEFVLKTDIWNLRNSDILPALRVSYHFLPPQLKRCFAYCSLFPKDHEFEEEEIILLWTAEGFLDQEYNGRKMEDLGRAFFRELHSRSLFQQSSKDASRFVMHDLINDLARWAAGEQYFRMEDTLAGENRQKFSASLRHFSYIQGENDGEKRLEFICDVQHLRTFLPVNLSDFDENCLAWSVLQRLLNVPRLRVFSLRGYFNIYNLPNEIGNLKHLRCLNLSGTSIQILPESINSLYNLHTILLEGCHRLKKLCNDMGNLKKLRHLRNSGAYKLKEMSKGFGRLTSLLTLCRFVVGKDSRSGLRELKSLTHLQGTLRISKLENVKDVGDASEAQLNNKVNLEALILEWRARSERCEFETQVLSMLKPHPDVQELTITGYSGTKFPIWLGDSSFSKLARLKFEGCDKCTSLPSVGQLPFLKKLDISGMDGLVSVGSQFYGNSRSVPFQSLETLSFEDMHEWEEWIPFGSGQEVDEVFPKLRKLSLFNCHKLRGTLPKRLLLLETLDITHCDQLVVTIQYLPALSELRINGCKKVVFSGPMDLSSLKSEQVDCIAKEVVLSDLFEQGLPKLESLEISYVREQTYLWQSETRLLQDVRSINRLRISSCPRLLSLVTEEEHDQQQPESPCRLQFLELTDCEGLTRLPQALLTLSSLTEMWIQCCDSLVSFPEVALPSRLRTIEIGYCNALKSLPEAWMHNSNSSLESLSIRSCNSLVSFPEVGLPSRLRTIEIERCDALKSLPEAWMHNSNSSLESLKIESCNSLFSFPEVGLPSRLRTVKIRGCNALKSLSEAWMHNSNSSLESLEIWSCNSLVSFSQAALPSQLRSVVIERCNALKSLHEAWMHNSYSSLEGLENSYSSLEGLEIWSCNSLVSFPEVALPSQLRSVVIKECDALESLPEAWMHHSNSSLESLKIESCNSLVSFPEVGLPSRLRTIEIRGCNALKSLPEAWMHNSNSSLESLKIESCNSLVSFPEVGLPSRLRTIEIRGCNALKSLPEAWMHNSNSSLESLKIRSCNSLVSFPEVGLPSHLRSVVIEECDALESLPEAWMHNQLPAALEHLEVRLCSNLALLSRNGNLPWALKCLHVSRCSKLESLAERLDNTSLEEITISELENLKSLPAGLHNLHHLQKIRIVECPNLESFPEEGLPSTKLTELKIQFCKNLKALPNCMHNLTSLLNLEIRFCPSVVSFPEDGFPTNLHSLEIADLKISKALIEWGFNRFTSLRKLRIQGGCPDLVSLPPFPASLTDLSISHMPDLENISSIGENLTSLQTLNLDCCPKLTDFSKEGLPKSLLKLIIDHSPLLEERCLKEYWPMISNIRIVEINRLYFFEGFCY